MEIEFQYNEKNSPGNYHFCYPAAKKKPRLATRLFMR